MIRVYDCLVENHDLALVALAVLICAFSCLVTFQIYGRARATRGAVRLALAGAAGLVGGLGTWATHFVAMLAFQPGTPIAYEPGATLASLMVGIIVIGGGSTVALWSASPPGRLLGGGLAGLGVGAMHFTGIAAMILPGRLAWDAGFVVAAVTLGTLLAAGAFALAGRGERPGRLCAAALVLAGAIASLHFTGMAAVTLAVDPALAAPVPGVSETWLAAMVAIGACLVLCIGAVAIVVDLRARRGESARLRDFADAALEGLVICSDGLVVDANASFCRLVGAPAGGLRGRALDHVLAIGPRQGDGDPAAGSPVEGEVRRADGSAVPVSVITRELAASGQRNRTVYAVRDLTEQRAAEQRIRFLAHHDALTGLPNRGTFADALQAAIAQGRLRSGQVAVLCVDLDHFKNVNDLHGHPAGDRVLVEAARRMTGLLSPGDLLARIGGDEFAILHVAPDDRPGTAIALASRIVEALTMVFEIAAGQACAVGASIGLAVGPRDGDDPERLLANADIALHRAKAEGRGRFRCFETAMDTQVRDRHALIADLRRAIGHDELTLFYQPQVRGSTGELIGFEALVRWNHPTRGMIPPMGFIPLAEESRQIIALGEWVLRTACREAASWRKPLKVAVNLSPLQFQQGNLPEMVHAVLLETGLPASRLEIEVTETVIINDMARALSLLRRLKSLGITIAMDDFGTGYSSLATLQAFPFDKIKIDRSFVSKLEVQPQAAVIVRAVLGLGRSLGIGVVAEGVETQDQMRFLAAEACDEVQGYLFGKPQPVGCFAAELQAGGPPAPDAGAPAVSAA